MTETLMFVDDVAPDSVPPLADVEHACEKCGNETGWSGRGRKKKLCDNCKPSRSSTPGIRVTGNTATLAAQAAKTLSSINAMLAMGIGALGFLQSMSVAFDRNEDFEKAAYAALVTDPSLCRQILSVGQTSAKITLGIAYFSYGMGIMPVLAGEVKEKKARRAAMEMDE